MVVVVWVGRMIKQRVRVCPGTNYGVHLIMGAVSLWTRPLVLHLKCKTPKRTLPQTSNAMMVNESEAPPTVSGDSWNCRCKNTATSQRAELHLRNLQTVSCTVWTKGTCIGTGTSTIMCTATGNPTRTMLIRLCATRGKVDETVSGTTVWTTAPVVEDDRRVNKHVQARPGQQGHRRPEKNCNCGVLCTTTGNRRPAMNGNCRISTVFCAVRPKAPSD